MAPHIWSEKTPRSHYKNSKEKNIELKDGTANDALVKCTFVQQQPTYL